MARGTDKATITRLIAEQNYEEIVALAATESAKVLRYVQMNIWGDYRSEQRWHALMALGALAEAYGAQQDEIYRNVIRRAVWAMSDESGNVPWAAPEMMSVVIKACPKQYKEFVSIMIANGIDSPMCHPGVLWSLVYLGPDFKEQIDPLMKRITKKLLKSKNPETRGMAIWALKRLQYEVDVDTMNKMADNQTPVWIFEQGVLRSTTVGQIVEESR